MRTTVKQLIEQLERCDPDATVIACGTGGVGDWERELLMREVPAGVLLKPGARCGDDRIWHGHVEHVDAP